MNDLRIGLSVGIPLGLIMWFYIIEGVHKLLSLLF